MRKKTADELVEVPVVLEARRRRTRRRLATTVSEHRARGASRPRRPTRAPVLGAGRGRRVRRAYSMVPAIQIASAGIRNATRNCQPDSSSSFGDLLGDADLERIDEAERGADRRGAQAHGDGREGIEARAGTSAGAGPARRRSAPPASGSAPRRWRRPAPPPESPAVPVPTSAATSELTSRVEGAGPLHDGESAPDQEDVEDDRGGVDHPARDADQRLERSDRAWPRPARRCRGPRRCGRWPDPPAAGTRRPEAPRSARPRAGCRRRAASADGESERPSPAAQSVRHCRRRRRPPASRRCSRPCPGPGGRTPRSAPARWPTPRWRRRRSRCVARPGSPP